MLVLGRRKNESIIIKTSDGEIRVTVLERKNGHQRLGFDAPDSVKILREEVAERLEGKPIEVAKA